MDSGREVQMRMTRHILSLNERNFQDTLAKTILSLIYATTELNQFCNFRRMYGDSDAIDDACKYITNTILKRFEEKLGIDIAGAIQNG